MLSRKGRYLPVFASAVHDGNKGLVAAGKKPINLQSVMIGNGITDFRECISVRAFAIRLRIEQYIWLS